MALNETLFIILEENALEGNSKLKPLEDAVINRNLITFYYTGPSKGKNKVKQGDRVKPIATPGLRRECVCSVWRCSVSGSASAWCQSFLQYATRNHPV